MRHLLAVLGLLTIAPATPAEHEHEVKRPAAREWTRQPLLLPAMPARGERAVATLRLTGIVAAELRVYAADGPAERRLVAYAVGPEGAKIEPAAPKVGNYHWLVARQEGQNEVRVASSAWYWSNPGAAPGAMLAQVKHELEIVPAPLPREHGNYRESEKWRFLVRWLGQPLPNQALTLETEFGSRSTVTTDADGIATVLFPRDYRPPRDGEPAGHGPRRAKFVLATEKEADGRRYLTAFNYGYTPDPDRERSLGWGALFGALGMVAATPLLRRRATRNDTGATHA
jgi:hypothetical protein